MYRTVFLRSSERDRPHGKLQQSYDLLQMEEKQYQKTLVIAIENPYRGILTLDKNGLPVTDKPNHGIGLRSVRNIVERYKGSMEIETHNQLFNVSILMYAPDK